MEDVYDYARLLRRTIKGGHSSYSTPIRIQLFSCINPNFSYNTATFHQLYLQLNGSFADLPLRLIPLFTTSSPRPRVLRVLRSAGIDIPIQPLPRTDRHILLHNMADSTPILTPPGSSPRTPLPFATPPPPPSP